MLRFFQWLFSVRGKSLSVVLMGTFLIISVSACSSLAVSAQERRVAFLGYVDAASGLQVFTIGEGGIEQVSRTDEIREMRGLGGDLLAVETRGTTGRFFKKLNIKTGKIESLFRPGKAEEFPLFSEDGASMLTVRQRPRHYEIQLWKLIAPHNRETILSSETHLSPRAWPCSGKFAYFLETDTKKIIRLDLSRKVFDDVTPRDLAPRELTWFSVSCDGRTVAVSFFGGSKFARLQVYRDGQVVRSVENAIEPDVSKDGEAVVYLDGFEPLKRNESDIPSQRIMQYDVNTARVTELVGPSGLFGSPIFVE